MKTLQRLALNYYLDGEIMYKRLSDGTLLRYLDGMEVKKAFQEVHEGVCATHTSRHMTTRQIKRSEYFWFTLKKYSIEYVRRCHKCQI
jgi:hypothetical protein